VLTEPVDTFFFRDHRPFQMGADAAASGMFPPRPGTVYGALRAAYIADYGGFHQFYQGNDPWLKTWMGTPNRPGDFQLRGVWPFGAGQVLLPVPLDMQVVFDSTRSDEKFVAVPLHLKPDDANLGSDGSKYRFYARKKQKAESPQGFVVGEADWRHFALVGKEVRPVTPLRRWIDETMRIGIARDPLRGTAEEHMLYRLPMATFSERAFEEALKAFEAASFEALAFDPHSRGATVRYGLAAAVSSTALPDRQLPPWLRLGGENRPWRVELSRGTWSPLSDQVEEEVIRCIEKTGVARLILLTPAIWERGDRPQHFDLDTRRLAIGRYVRPANASLESGQVEERVEKEPKEPFKDEANPSVPEVEVLAVATGRPLLVGGWDIVRNRPKPRLPAVPAGTVLVVRVPKGQARMLAKAVRAAAFTDDLSWEGYGFVTLGAYKEGSECIKR